MKVSSGRHPSSGFGDDGIAAAARTGHNAAGHDSALGLSDRPASGKA